MTLLVEADAWMVEALAPALPADTQCVPDVTTLRDVLSADPAHDLVVIGPDTELEVVVEFAAAARTGCPTLGVVLVRRRVDTHVLKEALRAGVREVVKADDLAALAQACQESLAVSEQLHGGLRDPAPSSHDKATLITVFSAKGGCGKTTMATNMAAAAARSGRRTCLVDLDLAFGDVAIALQLYPERGIADVVAMQGGIDRKGVSSLVTPHSERLDTVLAPVEPGAAETISAEMIASLLSVLKDMYDVVVVDTPPLFNDHVLAAFDASDHLALVTTLDIPALKNLKLTLETLELLGYPRDRWHVVLNRADAKVGLSVDDVTTTLHMQIAAQVPSSRAVPSAINRGVAIVQDSPGHPVSTALRRLTEALLSDGQGAAGRPRRHRSLGRRRHAAEVST